MRNLYELTLQSLRVDANILPGNAESAYEIWLQHDENGRTVRLLQFASLDEQQGVFAAATTRDGDTCGADSEMECLDIIANYLQKAKFIFHRDKELYLDYLTQLKYFVSHVVASAVRQELLAALVAQQALRQRQFTLRDSDLVQLVLDIVYKPAFKPILIKKGEPNGEI